MLLLYSLIISRGVNFFNLVNLYLVNKTEFSAISLFFKVYYQCKKFGKLCTIVNSIKLSVQFILEKGYNKSVPFRCMDNC